MAGLGHVDVDMNVRPSSVFVDVGPLMIMRDASGKYLVEIDGKPVKGLRGISLVCDGPGTPWDVQLTIRVHPIISLTEQCKET